MKFELFLAKKLQIFGNDSQSRSSAFTLNIAVAGIILAMIIMIASVAIVSGFKKTIISKISELEPHIEIANGSYENTAENLDSITLSPSLSALKTNLANKITSLDLVAKAPCIIKTHDEFNGLMLKGVKSDYNSGFLISRITEGKFNVAGNNIVVSEYIARLLNLKVNDKISVYFIQNEKVKLRKLTVAGLFNTDFEDFDKNYIIGNIGIVQSVNRWGNDTGTSVEIHCNSIDDIAYSRQCIIDELYKAIYNGNENQTYRISTIQENNASYFAWLDLLDTNIIVILILMLAVSCFSLVAGLLIVVLNRTNMIGILKSLGASNASIRLLFICLSGKIIAKSMIWGNLIGFTLILIQKYFHIIKLNPATYYMSYVPVDINSGLLLLNIIVLVISILSLIAPSYIVSSISPAKTMKFE